MILETILALSAVDYDHLARAVQVEAAPNTRDEFCVAVSILNRVRSPHYPNTVAVSYTHLTLPTILRV